MAKILKDTKVIPAVVILLSLVFLYGPSLSYAADMVPISLDIPFNEDLGERSNEIRERIQQSFESSDNTNSNTQIQSSRQSSGTLSVDEKIGPYSGKITTVQFDNNGQPLRTFYGDWNLNTESGTINFTASFTMNDLVKNTSPFRFSIDNVNINSIQQSNNDFKFGGISDISRQSTVDGDISILEKIPTTITIIENKALVITFANSNFPITGTVES